MLKISAAAIAMVIGKRKEIKTISMIFNWMQVVILKQCRGENRHFHLLVKQIGILEQKKTFEKDKKNLINKN